MSGEGAETHGDVGVGGLSTVQIVLGEELGQLRLNSAQRLVLAVEQQDQVQHGEVLTHQGEQVSEEPCTAHQHTRPFNSHHLQRRENNLFPEEL